MGKGAFVGVENFVKRELPSGYTQIEYIESSGTQYIDTGFKPNQDTRVQVKYSYSSEGFILGAETAWKSNSYDIHDKLVAYNNTSVNFSSANPTNTVIEADFNKNSYSDSNGKTASLTYATFSSGLNLYLFGSNRGGTLNEGMTGKIYSCKIYDNGTLVRYFIPCKNSSGTVGMYDVVNGTFYLNSGSGTFTAGSELKSVARKIKGGYIGINDVARKIKKAYIGVAGVARPCWAGGELTYYGTTTSLVTQMYNLAGESVGEYALFAGGYDSDGAYSKEVCAYNGSLVRSRPSTLSVARSDLAGASNGDYALFAGGKSSTVLSNVDAYNSALTRSTPTALSTARRELAGESVGEYALFAGGYVSSASAKVDAYNKSLVRSTPTELSVARSNLAGASNGDYALFAGGKSSTVLSNVDAYDKNLVRSTPTELSVARSNLAGASNGSYMLFAGGSGNSAVVDAYDKSLVRSTPTALSVGRYWLAGESSDEYALFAGGYNSRSMSKNNVDVYDTSLVRTSANALSAARGYLDSAKTGEYILFAGGYYNSSSSTGSAKNTVDVYMIA